MKIKLQVGKSYIIERFYPYRSSPFKIEVLEITKTTVLFALPDSGNDSRKTRLPLGEFYEDHKILEELEKQND